MTDREKLIELLKAADRYEFEETRNSGVYDREAAWGYIADHLIANGVTFQKWIPVSERLPEDNRQVLACTKKGKAFSAHYDHRWKSWSVSHTVKITHWMPLPEPPAE